MAQHDRIAALGHHRQFGAGLVWPQPQPQVADPQRIADRLDLLQMAPGFGASLVQVFQRCARQFELSRRFQADGAVGPGHGDDIAAFDDRFPAKLDKPGQQIADTARLVI